MACVRKLHQATHYQPVSEDARYAVHQPPCIVSVYPASLTSPVSKYQVGTRRLKDPVPCASVVLGHCTYGEISWDASCRKIELGATVTIDKGLRHSCSVPRCRPDLNSPRSHDSVAVEAAWVQPSIAWHIPVYSVPATPWRFWAEHWARARTSRQGRYVYGRVWERPDHDGRNDLHFLVTERLVPDYGMRKSKVAAAVELACGLSRVDGKLQVAHNLRWACAHCLTMRQDVARCLPKAFAAHNQPIVWITKACTARYPLVVVTIVCNPANNVVAMSKVAAICVDDSSPPSCSEPCHGAKRKYRRQAARREPDARTTASMNISLADCTACMYAWWSAWRDEICGLYHPCVCKCMYMYVCVYMLKFVYVYACTCMYMYACLHVSTCVSPVCELSAPCVSMYMWLSVLSICMHIGCI